MYTDTYMHACTHTYTHICVCTHTHRHLQYKPKLPWPICLHLTEITAERPGQSVTAVITQPTTHLQPSQQNIFIILINGVISFTAHQTHSSCQTSLKLFLANPEVTGGRPVQSSARNTSLPDP